MDDEAQELAAQMLWISAMLGVMDWLHAELQRPGAREREGLFLYGLSLPDRLRDNLKREFASRP